MNNTLRLFFAAAFFVVTGSVALAQPEHTGLWHRKHKAPPPPKKEEAVAATPVLSEDSSIFIPNSVCIDDPDFLPRIGNSIIPHDYSMRIFDRWGTLLYSNNDVAKGWNGRPDGKNQMLPEGTVCYYLIHFTDQHNIEHELKGYVMVYGLCHCG